VAKPLITLSVRTDAARMAIEVDFYATATEAARTLAQAMLIAGYERTNVVDSFREVANEHDTAK